MKEIRPNKTSLISLRRTGMKLPNKSQQKMSFEKDLLFCHVSIPGMVLLESWIIHLVSVLWSYWVLLDGLLSLFYHGWSKETLFVLVYVVCFAICTLQHACPCKWWVWNVLKILFTFLFVVKRSMKKLKKIEKINTLKERVMHTDQ